MKQRTALLYVGRTGQSLLLIAVYLNGYVVVWIDVAFRWEATGELNLPY